MEIFETFHTDRQLNALAFGSHEIAEAYDARPGYPAEAIAYILDHATPHHGSNELPRILDAGAGNGLVTEGIIDSGREVEVFALDKSEPMIAAFRQRIGDPSKLGIVGAFENMPLADDSIDAVIFGDALWWGDPDQLPKELFRVLRSGGSVAALGNITRPNTEFSEILARFPNARTRQLNPMTSNESITLGTGFIFAMSQEFPHDINMTPDGFSQYLWSISMFHTSASELSQAVWDQMQDYAKRHITADGLIPVAFDTTVHIARVQK